MGDLRELIEQLEKLEEWRPIPGWPYEASSEGRLRSTRTGRILRPSISSGGYAHASFQVDNRRKDVRVHRAIYEAWRGPLGANIRVNHIDGNKLNNRPENLEAVTGPENIKHAQNTGLWPFGDRHWTRKHPHLRLVGERLPFSKLTEEKVRQIRKRRESGERLATIARDYGVDRSLISQIALRKIWNHVD